MLILRPESVQPLPSLVCTLATLSSATRHFNLPPLSFLSLLLLYLFRPLPQMNCLICIEPLVACIHSIASFAQVSLSILPRLPRKSRIYLYRIIKSSLGRNIIIFCIFEPRFLRSIALPQLIVCRIPVFFPRSFYYYRFVVLSSSSL